MASTTFSPRRTTAAPPACLASFPVSNEICFTAGEMDGNAVASGFIIHSFGKTAQLRALAVSRVGCPAAFAFSAKGAQEMDRRDRDTGAGFGER